MVPAVIVSAVRDHEQDMPVMACAFHLRNAEVDRVNQGGPALGFQ